MGSSQSGYCYAHGFLCRQYRISPLWQKRRPFRYGLCLGRGGKLCLWCAQPFHVLRIPVVSITGLWMTLSFMPKGVGLFQLKTALPGHHSSSGLWTTENLCPRFVWCGGMSAPHLCSARFLYPGTGSGFDLNIDRLARFLVLNRVAVGCFAYGPVDIIVVCHHTTSWRQVSC